MKLNEIRKRVIDFHKKREYEIKKNVLLDNDAFPHTFNASAAETYMKEIIEKGVKNPRGKFIVIQPCFRRVDTENINLNGYISLFEMVGKIVLNPVFPKKEILSEMLEMFVEEFNLDKERIWITVFGGGKIAKIGKTKFPSDKETVKIWEEIGISQKRIVEIKSNGEDIDNFLIRFEREWEKYAGYGTDIFYDLGKEYSKGSEDIKPGNVKGGRFLEVSTIWMLDKWRESDYGEEVKLGETSNFKNFAIGFSLERLAFVLQKTKHILEIDELKPFLDLVSKYLPKEKKYEAVDLLRAIYFILSEGNKPSGKGKGYDLRLLFRKLFKLLNGEVIEEEEELIRRVSRDNRKEIFSQISLREKDFIKDSYNEFLKIHKRNYPSLGISINEVLGIYSHEKMLFYENKYKRKVQKIFTR